EESEDSDTSSVRSTPSDFIASLSPDHPFTHTTPTLVLFIRRTARMAVRVPLAMSHGLSANIAEVVVMSDLAFQDDEKEDDEEEDKEEDEDEKVDESSDSDSEREDAKDEGSAAGDEGLAAKGEGPASPAMAEAEGFLTDLGAQVEMHEGLINDYTIRLGELSPALFEKYDRDIGELFTRAFWRPLLALESLAGQTDAQRAALWYAISDTQIENQELRLQITEERHARLDFG
nr:hypothetical protein [Tanacetum cinerariifolium]